MNTVSIYKTLARKPTQTFSADYRSFLLTVNSQQPTEIKNVTPFAKLLFLHKRKIGN